MTLELTLKGDTQVVVTRHFAASPMQVYRAHIDPDLLRQWMTGEDGWNITKVEADGREGGDFCYSYASDAGESFDIAGTFLELDPGKRILHVERMMMPDPTPDNRIETLFEATDTGTLMTMTMTLPDAASREEMLAMGVEQGMEVSFARIDGVFGL